MNLAAASARSNSEDTTASLRAAVRGLARFLAGLTASSRQWKRKSDLPSFRQAWREFRSARVGRAARARGRRYRRLNADGAEVGEAAEGKRGDGEGARIKRALHGTEKAESDECIEGHAGAEEIADDG